jgi:hypothetical protein
VARAAAVPPEQSLAQYETLGDAKAALYQALEGLPFLLMPVAAGSVVLTSELSSD